MAIVDKKGGKLPAYMGDWSATYNDGHGYMVKNRVTIFGSELESLIDNNTYIPATRDEQTGVVTFDEHWKVISNGSQAYAAALAATNKMAELEEEWDDQDQRMAQMQATINTKQLEVGAVQTDEVPTENSGNHMTSGDIYQTLKNPNKGFVDNTQTFSATNLATSGAVASHGSAFDISEYNKNGDTLATYATLDDALTAIPLSVRKGGMSIKFVQSSDNKYVQYRYMSSSTAAADFTNVTNWQGVEEKPTPGSDNLLSSGGVSKAYGGDTQELFDVIQNTFLEKYFSYNGNLGDKIYLRLDPTSYIDANGVTVVFYKNNIEIQRAALYRGVLTEFILSDDVDSFKVTRSSGGIIGTGSCSITIKMLHPFYTKEESDEKYATKSSVTQVTSELSDEITTINRQINGGNENITDNFEVRSPSGYYNYGSIGSNISFTQDGSSIAYDAVDLSEYNGKTIEVLLTSSNTSSSRSIALCDASGKIGALFTEGEIANGTRAIFTIDSTYCYLYISYRLYSTSNFGVIVFNKSLEEKIEDELLEELDKKEIYVSPNGSDIAAGTKSAPLKTITAALAKSNKIMLLGGVYGKETINPNTYDYEQIEIIGLETTRSIINFGDRFLVNDGSETLVSGYTKVYQVACETFPFSNGATHVFMWQDYVDDPNTLIDIADRHPLQRGRTYRCDSTKIQHVTSIAAIEALPENQYGWYWNNGVMYFSRPQASSASHPIVMPKREAFFIDMRSNFDAKKQIKVILNNIEVRYASINLSYTTNCVLSDVLVKYPYVGNGGCFYIYACQNCSLIRCEAAGVTNGEGIGDGFNVDTAGTADDAKALCLSLYMRDCWAHDIWDDGYSDHDNSEVTIDGGLFEYCGKGGLTPASGSNDVIRNAICRYNRGAGILVAVSPEVSRVLTNVAAHNCICYGQTDGFKTTSGCDLKCYDCISYNNTTGYNANAGNIYAINCKSDDTTLKTGNVTVVIANALP